MLESIEHKHFLIINFLKTKSMGTFKINSKSTQVSAVYRNDVLHIDVNYQQNTDNGKLLNINGTIYRDEDKTYAGSFSGNNKGGEMDYSFNGIKPLSFMESVTAAVGEIEDKINSASEKA